MCKYYLYCRVSTDNHNQEFERQKLIAKNAGYVFDEIFEEKISGGIRGNQRQEFSRMLEKLDADTTVVVSETSRFGRNYLDCLDMIDLITQERNANIIFISNGMELKGGEKLTPYSWLTLSMFFIMDEFQKRQIGYNTKNALQAKKKNGVVLGRPKSDNAELKNQILSMLATGMRQKSIAHSLGIDSSKVCRILKN